MRSDLAGEIAARSDRRIGTPRDDARKSRPFAREIIHGAPILGDVLAGPLRELVEAEAAVIRGWIEAGKLAPVDPRHLIFAIWATTQHYADFDAQVRAVLGTDDEARFAEAAGFLKRLFLEGLRPR